MKKLSYLLSIFTVALTLFLAINLNNVNADASCNTVKVYVHYHRWAGDYDGLDIWHWGNTTANAGGAALSFTADDAFGKVAVMNVNSCEASNDGVGIIIRKSDWSYKDGVNTDNNDGADNKFINVSKIKDGTVTSDVHVYVLQGSNDVIQEVAGDDNAVTPSNQSMGKLFVVYYRPNGDYADWNLWTWGNGTGGTNTDGNAGGVPFYWSAGLDGGTNADLFQVAMFNVATDASNQAGLIVRTDAWAKDNSWTADYSADFTDANGHSFVVTGGDAGNRLIDVTDIKGTGSKFVFLVQDTGTIFEDFASFQQEAFKLEFDVAEMENTMSLTIELSSAQEYDAETGPDKALFSVKDEDGKALVIDSVAYDKNSEQGTAFTLMFKNPIDITKTYTVTYNYKGVNGEDLVATGEVEILDTDLPVLTITSGVESGNKIYVKQGAKEIEKPTFTALDETDGDITDLVIVEGKVNTAKPGNYEVTYTAVDAFGNEVVETVTVVVESNPNIFYPYIGGAVVILLLAGVGIFFATRKKD